MYYNTLFVGMDVHKENFTLCCYDMMQDKILYTQKLEPDYNQILKYLTFVRKAFRKDVDFVCGYEAGCLGFTLYHQLTRHGVSCVILAPTTMMKPTGKKKIKTDKRDAALIARCLASNNFSPVHVPTTQDEEVKEFLRMRDDHKLALKKVKQQILSFCLRHGFSYSATKNHWTAAHITWLRSLKPEGLYSEILSEYLLTFQTLSDKLERLDQRIEELAATKAYSEGVKKLSCFLGIKTHTALATMVEVGDFQRFASANQFASYIGLVPGEDSSSESVHRLGITKAGNTHVRRLLVEAAQSYTRGQVGYKSAALKKRQAGNTPEVIAYADRANERLRRKYYKMVLSGSKRSNVAKTAVARELACFIWGMMTNRIV